MENNDTRERIYWRPYFTRYVLPLAVVVALLSAWVSDEAPIVREPYPMSAMEHRSTFRYQGSFNRDFNDLNDIQLTAALNKGVAPARTRQEMERRKGMVHICTNPNYVVEDLTHSVPYVVEDMADLLDEIGLAFIGELAKDTLPLYRPIITSVTRTEEDVKKLRRGNGNASENSTHQYGTTVDISWRRFDKVDHLDPRSLSDEELKHLLAIVLRRFHDDGRVYIKHERRQACFHMTVR
ncbi:hypothetical protein IX332_001034 [Porphyromonas levii]|nr:DUF5715 family protein [Porphyromonas levii]MBR8729711.1 hypothetical protein [Porphyromonas levii]MBR8763657.1 hypothetical protein [Porphyromonas levii]